MNVIEHLTGPFGGIMAMMFGFGFAAGYGFAQKTVMSEAKKRISHLEEKLAMVERELHDILREDRNKE